MTVDDLMNYYIDDYIEIYCLENDEIVFKGSKYDDDYDEEDSTTQITGKKNRRNGKSEDDYNIDFVDI